MIPKYRRRAVLVWALLIATILSCESSRENAESSVKISVLSVLELFKK